MLIHFSVRENLQLFVFANSKHILHPLRTKPQCFNFKDMLYSKNDFI